MEKYAVIMAGGAGTRLWPISRKNKPKQFICVNQDKSMLLMTVQRILKSIPGDRCFIITDKNLFQLTRDEVMAYIPEDNIILEPEKKNTAACITYAALLLKKKFGHGLLYFVPADSYIENIYDGRYMTALFHAFNTAEKSGNTVVVGINPTYPAVGYGYIRFDPETCPGSKEVFHVEEFVEKPDPDTAETYLESGRYLWNSGMVIGSTESILNNIKCYLPEHYRLLSEAVRNNAGPDAEISLNYAYAAITPISFDFGVLEKCKDLYVVRAFFAWNDIGSLVSLSDTFEEDTNGNRFSGHFFGMDSTGNVIYSSKDLITAIGIQAMIIVQAGDAVVVCPKDRAQEVRLIVEGLMKNGFDKYL